ncbi:MAG: OmpA family protein [Bacteroidetes bacterium]|nr:OmpA family protein [Bacteroidota bacterium]MCL2302086.1 OmpA family protein [Lentimicrobiaceae bacterium]
MNRIFALLLVLCITFSAFGQKKIAAGDNAFASKQFDKALTAYKKGLKKVGKNQVEVKRVTYQIAECYRIMGDLKRAENQYLRLEKRNHQKDEPLLFYHLGSINHLKGEYEKALNYYLKYQERVPDDVRIEARIEGVRKAKGWMENPTNYEVENFKKINTKQDEWAPRWSSEKQNQMIFSSNRDGSTGKGIDQWTGKSFSDIYKIDRPRGKSNEWIGEWSNAELLDDEGLLNSEVNEGEAVGNRKGSEIYFTKCPIDKKSLKACYIYVSEKRGRSFSEPKLVELSSDSLVNCIHPALSADEQTLYFASDMPGGYGGFDLYKATRSGRGGKFGNVENLGPIVNSPGNELFPAMRGDSMLYFSSDGHPGMGGLDIFYSVLRNGAFQTPENMMYPINTCWDEIGIIFYDEEIIDPKSKAPYLEMGFFSSNRPGGRGGDDIYHFQLRPTVFTLAGTVRDENNRQAIDGAEIEIIGSNGTSYKAFTDIRGNYAFDRTKILMNTTYTIRLKKAGYWDIPDAVQTTIGLSEDTDIRQDFLLARIPKDPIVMPDIYYDLDKWDLKPQYEDSLMYLYFILVQNPNLVVELRSHTDSRGSEERNDLLSQNRAQSCVNFLVNDLKIDAERIVPKGYGKSRPRRLDKDIMVPYNGKMYAFKRGVTLDDNYIKALPNRDQQEAAHQLNRRTEFIVLRDDFVPKSDSIAPVSIPRPIAVIKKHVIPVQISGNDISGNCRANGKNVNFVLSSKKTEDIFMDYETATRFLREFTIEVDDFELGEKALKNEDGSIIENSVLYLRELAMGDDYAENVRVVIKKGLPAAFVVGTEFISEEWGKYEIDREKGEIVFEK